MEDLLFDIKALVAVKGLKNITELAEACGIEPSHLQLVSSGRARMLGEDLKKLIDYTGIPYNKIKTDY